MRQELGGDHGTDRVTAQVFRARAAAAVAVEAGDRVAAARLQLAAEDIVLAHASSIPGRSTPDKRRGRARPGSPQPGEQVVLGDRGSGGIAGPDEALPAERGLGDVLRDLAEPRILYLAGVGEQGFPLTGELRPDIDRGGDALLGLGHLPHRLW